ncbi:uncharacterized protein DDB_G0287625-like [Chrysoperla carnea]|uniref:uncharacterized protein DDB_G0287625-like n=1 Tax=Chrysoperla carnea TaxID=189513 RepID=UPI001D090C4A|nr:uncharacterized protein DDB_G0287625-like [Chrysoperla carnea]
MKLIIFTIICIFMVTTCFAQTQPANTINAFNNTSMPANFSSITNATIVHNTATNQTYLLLPANDANFTALQQQFGNNTPQFIQNNTVILIPFNVTQHPNISEQFPSVVNRTYILNMTSYDQRPNQSTMPGNTNNPGMPSVPSPPMYPPRGDTGNTQGNYGFVVPTGNNPTSNHPNNPNIPSSNMPPKNTPNSNIQHINNPGQQPNHPNSNSGHQPNTTSQNKNSGTNLKSSLIYIVILEIFIGYLLF